MENPHSSSQQQGIQEVTPNEEIVRHYLGRKHKSVEASLHRSCSSHDGIRLISMGAASKSATDCLDATQNQGLRTILAATKSHSWKKHCECAPLDTRTTMKSSIQYEKSKRITTHTLRDVFAERTKNRLKRKSPNHIAREVAKEHNDITGCIPEQLEHHTQTLPHDLHPNVEICKEIPGIGRKGEQPAPVSRTITLDLIDEKCNNAEWTHVYTDGSAIEAVKYGRSGIFIKYPSGNFKRISIPAGHTC